MNKREAVAVQFLLDWVTSLVAFEVDPDRCDLLDEEVVRIIGVLADRSSTALGAGLRQGDAIAAAMRMCGLEPATVRATEPGEPTVRDLELPPDGEGPRSWSEELRAPDIAPNAGSAT